MTAPATCRRLRAIQRMCYIVLCGVCVQAMHCVHTTTGEAQNYNTKVLTLDARHAYMYTEHCV